jgi:hypothetical protein
LNASEFIYHLNFQSEQSGSADDQRKYSFNYFSSVRDLVGKWGADWFISNGFKIKSGLSYTKHRFIPFSSDIKRNENGQETSAEQSGRKINSSESVFFVESDVAVDSNLFLNLGIHTNWYRVDSRNYLSAQPRISGAYRLTNKSELRFGYTFMQQPIHLLTNNGPGLPTDLWVPATINAPPQKAWQYSLGYKKTISRYELSAEVYYKLMKGVIEYTEGANFLNTNKDWEEKIETGKGESYGLELFAQKKTGRMSGWMGYTLSWNKRLFPKLNGGKPFFYKYDHRHDYKAVVIYELKKNIDLSLSFVLNSGNRITLPTSFHYGAQGSFPYKFPDFVFETSNTNLIYKAGSRNNVQMKTYHRADVSINFHKEKRRGVRTWNISIYNVYSRLNPYYYYYKQGADGKLTLTQISLFPIIPSVSYNFKWH